MTLYLLKRREHVDYDEYAEKLVRADSPKAARLLANRTVGDEGKIWTSPVKVSCREVKVPGRAMVIISQYDAG